MSHTSSKLVFGLVITFGLTGVLLAGWSIVMSFVSLGLLILDKPINPWLIFSCIPTIWAGSSLIWMSKELDKV